MGKRRTNDDYPTPSWCTRALIDLLHEQYCFPRSILDPTAGAGAIVRELRPHTRMVTAIDINPENETALVEAGAWGLRIADTFAPDAQDYWKFESPCSAGIITNPPFSLARAVLEKALRTRVSIVAFLLRLCFLGSTERKEFMETNPPTDLQVLSPRPSFVKGATDYNDYAWYIWNRPKRALMPGNMCHIHFASRRDYE